MIDADYRGELKVLLFNFNDEDFAVSGVMHGASVPKAPLAVCLARTLLSPAPDDCRLLNPKTLTPESIHAYMQVSKGDRVAQLIIEKIAMLDIAEVEDLDATSRVCEGVVNELTPVGAALWISPVCVCVCVCVCQGAGGFGSTGK